MAARKDHPVSVQAHVRKAAAVARNIKAVHAGVHPVVSDVLVELTDQFLKFPGGTPILSVQAT